MRRIRNLNHQVSKADYVRCVGEQLAFLDRMDGAEPSPMTAAEIAEAENDYDRGVSVDASAGGMR